MWSKISSLSFCGLMKKKRRLEGKYYIQNDQPNSLMKIRSKIGSYSPRITTM